MSMMGVQRKHMTLNNISSGGGDSNFVNTETTKSMESQTAKHVVCNATDRRFLQDKGKRDSTLEKQGLILTMEFET